MLRMASSTAASTMSRRCSCSSTIAARALAAPLSAAALGIAASLQRVRVLRFEDAVFTLHHFEALDHPGAARGQLALRRGQAQLFFDGVDAFDARQEHAARATRRH